MPKDSVTEEKIIKSFGPGKLMKAERQPDGSTKVTLKGVYVANEVKDGPLDR